MQEHIIETKEESNPHSSNQPHRARLDRVRTLLGEHDADTVLLSSAPDVRWACGFTGSNALLFVQGSSGGGAAHFVTDGRYREQAAREVEGAEIHVTREGLIAHVAEQGLLPGGERVLFQSDRVTVAQREKWSQELEEVTWKPESRLLSKPVAKKDESEVEQLRAAQRLTEEVFEHVTSSGWRGRTERDVAAEIVYEHLQRGADCMAFDPIVAAGANGALPHARATDRTLQPGDVVVVDIGGVTGGYASDMTRVVSIGEPGDEVRAVHAVVCRAQEAAIAAARPGMESQALDAVARTVIAEAGYDEEDVFPHSLGHGLGLRTHEWPSVSHRRDYELPAGAVLTIEPGIYLPDRFGVRIEDTVVLREGGTENLTRLPREIVVC